MSPHVQPRQGVHFYIYTARSSSGPCPPDTDGSRLRTAKAWKVIFPSTSPLHMLTLRSRCDIADYIALAQAKARKLDVLCYERAVLVARQPKKEFLCLGMCDVICNSIICQLLNNRCMRLKAAERLHDSIKFVCHCLEAWKVTKGKQGRAQGKKLSGHMKLFGQ